MPTISVLNSNGDPQTVQTLPPPPGTVSAATAGTTSGVLLTADPTRSVVQIQNVSPTATIATNPGGAAVLNGAGCDIAYPGGYILYEGAAAQAAINAISDTASTPVTIKVG